ncbi:MAG: glutathione S-transferase N-terminal domain-containing protein [Acetobacteraceae bacterium]|nr:glutathione S-transferase N-terminal domain-containing protein [Acetobacteraceae bacterium]
MRTLWGRANSGNVMKVIWLLEELRLPYERIDVGGPFGGTDTPQYRAKNPTGLVPTLQEDEFALWESNVIMRYLASANEAGESVWPREARARARAECWLDCEQTRLARPQSAMFWGYVRTPPEKRDEAAIAQAVKDAAAAYALIAAALDRSPFIAGEHLTLADFAWGPHVHRWLHLPIPDRPEYPSLRRWYDRLLERPAYAAHVAVPLS